MLLDNLHIIILGGGKAYRLNSYGNKLLFKLRKNTTILDRQINLLTSGFDSKIINIVTGFYHDKLSKIINSRINIIENINYEISNDAYAIKLALEKTHCKNAIIIYGDLLFEQELVSNLKHLMNKEVYQYLYQSSVLFSSVDFNGKNYIQHFPGLPVVERLTLDEDRHKWAQILFLNEIGITKFKEHTQYLDKRFTWEIINNMIEKDKVAFMHYSIPSRIMDVDSTKELKKGKRLFK